MSVSCRGCGGIINQNRIGVVPPSANPLEYKGLWCIKCWEWLKVSNRAEERQPYADTLVVLPDGG